MFDIEQSARRAERRMRRVAEPTTRRQVSRQIRGRSSAPDGLELLREMLIGDERPNMTELLAELARRCRRRGLACPSRARIYNLLPQLEGHCYHPSELPAAVREVLYNLAADVPVPGRQLAFYCFNYGGVAAICFAAGLPWLDLYQARYLRGFRPKSRGLLEAACRVRGI